MAFKSKTLNKIMSNIVPNADEILANARGLHTKNYAKNKDIYNELTSTVKAGVGSADKLKKAKIDSGIAEKSANFSKAYDSNFDRISSYAQADPKGHYKTQRNMLNSMNGVESGRISNGIDSVKNYYFGDGVTTGARNSRIAATGAGAVGLGIGARYASGGSLTRTNEGERNIAGVPFV